MRIQHNMQAANANRQLGVVVSDQSKSTEKLSSGYRINRAADDAAGLAISEKMRGQIRGLNQSSTNAQDGISLIQTEEGALNETHSILQRMRELAVQSANGTETDDDRAQIQKEVDELIKEVDRIATDTEFNTMKLLDNSTPTIKLHVGANKDQVISFSNLNATANSLGVDTLNMESQANAESAIKTLDDAINTVSGGRATLGAVQNRLEHSIANVDTSSENLQSAESRIRDVDMAKEMVSYSKNNILMQASQSMLAQANQSTQGVLSLLQS